jgi:hypothetical protein
MPLSTFYWDILLKYSPHKKFWILYLKDMEFFFFFYGTDDSDVEKSGAWRPVPINNFNPVEKGRGYEVLKKNEINLFRT